MVPSTYTLPIQNQTGLDPAQFSVYVLGYSTASEKALQSDGTFGAFPTQTTTLTSYAINSLTQITVDNSSELKGARLYFFVVQQSGGVFTAPTVQFTGTGGNVTQPDNPPSSNYPPYSIVEITVPSGGLPTIDVQTVDGFIFPLTLTLTDAGNNQLGQVGQPLYATGQYPTVNRDAILAAYTTYMTNQGAAGAAYLDLKFTVNQGGILNPGLYLATVNNTNQLANLGSTLNSIWDSELNTLFSTTTLSLQGVSSGSIAADTYSATPMTLTYPGSTFTHPALQFKGDTNGLLFNVFNPVGLSVLTDASGAAIHGTINGATLTFTNSQGVNTPLAAGTPLLAGMYIQGAGVGPTNTITAVNLNASNQIVSVTLNANLGTPAPGSPYAFSKVQNLFETSGRMVFANDGVFADNTVQETNGDRQTVLANLENQLVSALNRGVANSGPTSGTAGYTSAHWGTQTNWYPSSGLQNLFAKFMHQGTVTDPSTQQSVLIFVNGQAYGFGFDENAGPVPPAPTGQPDVPSKFDPVPAATTTMTITLGPWKAPATQVVGNDLFVTGTNGSDVILALPGWFGRVTVLLNGRNLGTFAAIDEVFINGLDGNDFIYAAGVRDSLTIDGGAGHDFIVGGRGDDILIGGAGNDVLIGWRGRDQLFGGGGNDRLINHSFLPGWYRFWYSFISWLRIRR